MLGGLVCVGLFVCVPPDSMLSSNRLQVTLFPLVLKWEFDSLPPRRVLYVCAHSLLMSFCDTWHFELKSPIKGDLGRKTTFTFDD